MYRALEAHFVLYLALYKLYITTFIEKNQIIGKDLKESIGDALTQVRYYHASNNVYIVQNHQKILDTITAIKFSKLQKEFDTILKNQCKFYKIYMDLFEKLLMFIRVSREKNWELHLYSLHQLCPCFFAFDMTNYARMTPVYLSQMYELKKKDTRTWNLLNEGHFSISKSNVPFTAIYRPWYRAGESCTQSTRRRQRNSHSDQALDEYFLTAAELRNMIKDFYETFGINENQNTKSDDHYQLAGSTNTKIGNNVEKPSAIFNTYNVNFNHTDSVYNILAMKVLPAKESTRFLDSVKIGQERYEQFINQNVEGDSSTWDTLKKVMLPPFVNNNETVKVKENNKDVQALKSLTGTIL